MLRCIIIARSWPVLVRVGIVTIAVAAATALQLPVEAAVPGGPFLLYFVGVVLSASVLGRVAGFFAVAESAIASALFFEPVYSFGVTHAVDLLAIEGYAVLAVLSVEALCRFVESALAEKSAAISARIQFK